MIHTIWNRLPLEARVRRLRYLLPPFLAVIVVLYQLGVAQALETRFGHGVHYSVEIAFYSLVGPVITWLTLVWVERSLKEKQQLAQQITSLTAVSADAILSLDAHGQITSWNRGAEKMLGYTAAEIERSPLARLLPDAGILADRLEQAGTVQSFETHARTHDGRTINVDLTQTRLAEASQESPAALVIMRDVTARHERAAIVEEERARIARDLHDGVAQTLYFLALKADMARQQVLEQPEQTSQDLREIGRQTRQVIKELRRTIFALRPLDWVAGDFWPALRRFVEGFAEQVGWRAEVEIDETLPPLPSSLEPTLFRLVQESLNNVAKHADACRIWVNVRPGQNSGGLVLAVRDDGCGFDSASSSYRGLGVSQMRARAAAAGGRFSIESRAGSGTTVTAYLPIRGENNE